MFIPKIFPKKTIIAIPSLNILTLFVIFLLFILALFIIHIGISLFL